MSQGNLSDKETEGLENLTGIQSLDDTRLYDESMKGEQLSPYHQGSRLEVIGKDMKEDAS